MTIAFVMNAIALVLSCIMLIGWYADFTAAGETTLPAWYICSQLGIPGLYWVYNITLLLCFISTGVTTVYGFVSRFEGSKIFSRIQKPTLRRAVVSSLSMVMSMGVSLVGLDKIIKYGYGLLWLPWYRHHHCAVSHRGRVQKPQILERAPRIRGPERQRGKTTNCPPHRPPPYSPAFAED